MKRTLAARQEPTYDEFRGNSDWPRHSRAKSQVARTAEGVVQQHPSDRSNGVEIGTESRRGKPFGEINRLSDPARYVGGD